MITNIIRMKSKMDIQQTTVMIDIVLALHKLTKQSKDTLLCKPLFNLSYSLFLLITKLQNQF